MRERDGDRILGHGSFFDLDARYAALSAAGDPLEKLGGLIDFEIFRPALDGALPQSTAAGADVRRWMQ